MLSVSYSLIPWVQRRAEQILKDIPHRRIDTIETEPHGPLVPEDSDIAVLPAADLPFPLASNLEVMALIAPDVPESSDTDLRHHIAIVAQRYRGDLRARFHLLDSRRSFGKVFLVGAGPGDPEMLTLKAHRLLSTADLIVHDELVPHQLLTRYAGEKRHVGKRKGTHLAAQEEIHQILHAAARSGKTVVRLKGGDPFIFGRGGEEVRFLSERMIPVEVIPGITAAQSAAASTSIPLLHREVSRRLVIASGHRTGIADQGTTHALYMAASRVSAVAEELMEMGLAPDTPVALIRWAGMPAEETQITSLKEVNTLKAESPTLFLIGEVVRHICHPPRILYTGLDSSGFRHPGQICHVAMIETRTLDTEIDLHGIDGLIFTSQVAVDVLFSRISAPTNFPAWAIGDRTAEALRRRGVTDIHQPPSPDSDSLSTQIPDGTWLYPCSALSHNRLHTLPQVRPLVLYETIPVVHPSLPLDRFQGIVFTSPSTVNGFLRSQKVIPGHLTVYVMGPMTRKRVEEVGVAPSVIVDLSAGY